MSDIAIKVENISKQYRIGLRKERYKVDRSIGVTSDWRIRIRCAKVDSSDFGWYKTDFEQDRTGDIS